MTDFVCPECNLTVPHDHGWVQAWVDGRPAGDPVPSINYHSEDPYAEVRDPDTGEVIFPATKRPLRLIQGGRADEPEEGE